MSWWSPSASSEVMRTAVPSAASGTVPSTVVPSRKTTSPAGVPAPGAVTVAVKVTACPTVDGFGDELQRRRRRGGGHGDREAVRAGLATAPAHQNRDGEGAGRRIVVGESEGLVRAQRELLDT